jgi:crotonobetainyl-CoA:carnitine CoA-transferase CaiB-like acyl-CoA transferase
MTLDKKDGSDVNRDGGMLNDIRVLEISAPETMLGGQILGDLGADVIVIEPPNGAAGRRIEPFLDGVPGLDRSLTWHALNRNKRAITLDIKSLDGKRILGELAAKADIVLEAGYDSGLDDLDVAVTKDPIRCRITPFSRGGPKSTYRHADLIFMAASGAPSLAGDADRQPLFFPVPQAMMEAGAEAAVAALAGLAARDRAGISQTVELSVRMAALLSSLSRAVAGGSGDALGKRGADDMVRVPNMYECADGFMLISISMNRSLIHLTKGAAEWAADEGVFPRELASIDWANFEHLTTSGQAPANIMSELVAAIRMLCLSKTKADLTNIAHERGFMAAPVATMKDIQLSDQFRERGLFEETQLAGDGRLVRVPLRFAQFSDYSIELRRPAPLLSQHSHEVLSEDVGLSPTEIQTLFVHGVI